GTFWVLGANGTTTANHRIYHLDEGLSSVLGTIANPHPPGTIAANDLTTNRGIAYRASDGRLLVLASVGPRLAQELVILPIGTNGVADPAGAIVVDLENHAGTSLFGLALDPGTGDLWTVDVRGDRALRIGPDGAVVSVLTIPGKSTPSTRLWGHGIATSESAGESYLHVPFGDIFQSGPAKVIELLPQAEPIDGVDFATATGNETPLEVPSYGLRGLHAWTDRFATHHLTIVSEDGSIWDIERSISSPRPPTGLACFLNVNNQVELVWTNRGNGGGGAYGDRIQVLRNGTPVTTIDGGATAYVDTSPVEGTSSYSVRAAESSEGPMSDESCPCQVTVGRGGLVDWAPFPGTTIFDIAEHPGTREVFATDPVEGRIYRFDPELELIDSVPAPFPDPAGIAFVPAMPLGFPPQIFENLLAISESSGKRVRIVSADDPVGEVITTISLRLDDIDAPVLGGLTFKPDTRELYLVELSTRSVFRFASNGSLAGNCAPIFVGEPIGIGLTYDPIQNAFLGAFEDGLVRELFAQAACSFSDYSFTLEALGPSYEDDGFTGGLQISGNTLLVASQSSNALFRVLLFPFSPDFVRGDVNADEAVNLTDVVSIATYLFLAGPSPSCSDAADTNDDGILDVSDPVYLLFSLFVAGSPPPPAPYPEPGNDPTFRDNLGCAE
ncbi:MAG TPA: dockerin type I repeat-containing protein, partial [Planctomycetota bacterium]|nr:dockerin type I repeat-containing protein [Planctomycetota bacterium]